MKNHVNPPSKEAGTQSHSESAATKAPQPESYQHVGPLAHQFKPHFPPLYHDDHNKGKQINPSIVTIFVSVVMLVLFSINMAKNERDRIDRAIGHANQRIEEFVEEAESKVVTLIDDYEPTIKDLKHGFAKFEKTSQFQVDTYRHSVATQINDDVSQIIRSLPSLMHRLDRNQAKSETTSKKAFLQKHKHVFSEKEFHAYYSFFDGYHKYILNVSSTLLDEQSVDEAILCFRCTIKNLTEEGIEESPSGTRRRAIAYSHFAIANLCMKHRGKNWLDLAIQEVGSAVQTDPNTGKYKINAAIWKSLYAGAETSPENKLKIIDESLRLMDEAFSQSYSNDLNYSFDINNYAELLIQKGELVNQASERKHILNEVIRRLLSASLDDNVTPAVFVTMAEALSMKLDLESNALLPEVKDQIHNKIVSLIIKASSKGFDFEASSEEEFFRKFPRFYIASDPNGNHEVWKTVKQKPEEDFFWALSLLSGY